MNSSVVMAVLLIALLALMWLWVRSRGATTSRADAGDRLDTLAAWPPTVTRVLTSQERLAHTTLARAFPDHLILAQVPLSRFLRVPTRYSHAEWLRRVGQLCVDLVVCDTATQPLAVVIVEPAGGVPSERARVRHERMLRVLKSADIRCFVWSENAFPTVEIARASVLDLQTAAVAAGAVTSPGLAAAIATATPSDAPAVPLAAPGAFDDTTRDSTHPDELDDGREPPPTWYDDISSGPTPLMPVKPADQPKR